MTGTIVNTAAVLLGTTAGLMLGNRLPERIRGTIMSGLGLTTVIIGIQMAVRTENIMIALGSIVLGGIIGEILDIEDRLENLGSRIEGRIHHRAITTESAGGATEQVKEASSRFSRGFLMASLLFCVGPMAILGSFQDGLTGDYSTLSVKAMLDGFAGLALASSLGPGVILSSIPLFVYQGSLTLGASWMKDLLTEPMITEMTAAGGLLIVGLGINLLELRHVRVGNLLPAVAIAPIIVAILALIG